MSLINLTNHFFRSTDFIEEEYSVSLKIGKGEIVFCQVYLDDSDKTIRIYSRLLANSGAFIRSTLLDYVRPPQEHAINDFMALLVEPFHDLEAMTTYFTDPSFTLNNLGEGVYGWMKRLERRQGRITIPESADRTCFLTVFIDSDINRDPSQRETNILPDSSIVPDLKIRANCSFRLYVNGHSLFEIAQATEQVIEVDDVTLNQGVNRMCMICQVEDEDIQIDAWFVNKYGDPVDGLRYCLTLD